MGLSHYLIGNDFGKGANLNHMVNVYRSFRHDKKKLSRKRPGSANRHKARLRLTAQHEQVTITRDELQYEL